MQDGAEPLIRCSYQTSSTNTSRIFCLMGHLKGVLVRGNAGRVFWTEEDRPKVGGIVPPMAVNATHPDYDAGAVEWARARDVLAGEDAVKAGGEKYLPRLDSQTDEEFSAYVKRASYFNASARTSEAYLGLMFRRPPFVKLPADGAGVGRAMAQFQNDADMLGTTLTGYAKVVVGDVIGLGRAGTLVDWEDQAEQRAYVVFYSAGSRRDGT